MYCAIDVVTHIITNNNIKCYSYTQSLDCVALTTHLHSQSRLLTAIPVILVSTLLSWTTVHLS